MSDQPEIPAPAPTDTGDGEASAASSCSLLEVNVRPLLVSGQIARRETTGTPVILINSEQSREEQLVALWHEVVHLLRDAGGFHQDEGDVDFWAHQLAKAFPEAAEWVGIS